MMKNKLKKYRKAIVIVLMILIAMALLAGPALAGLIWEERWGHTAVVLDNPGRSKLFHSYGFYPTLDSANIFYSEKWTKSIDCAAYFGERVFAYTYNSGRGDNYAVAVHGFCVKMTETPCPTMDPYTP